MLKRVPRGKWFCERCRKFEEKVRHGVEARLRRVCLGGLGKGLGVCWEDFEGGFEGVGEGNGGKGMGWHVVGFDGGKARLPLGLGRKIGREGGMGRGGVSEEVGKREVFERRIRGFVEEVAEVLVAGDGMGLDSVECLEEIVVRVVAGLEVMFEREEKERRRVKEECGLPVKKRGRFSEGDNGGIKGSKAQESLSLNRDDIICKDMSQAGKERGDKGEKVKLTGDALLQVALNTPTPPQLRHTQGRDSQIHQPELTRADTRNGDALFPDYRRDSDSHTEQQPTEPKIESIPVSGPISQGALPPLNPRPFVFKKSKRGRPATRSKLVSNSLTVPVSIAPAGLQMDANQVVYGSKGIASNNQNSVQPLVGDKRRISETNIPNYNRGDSDRSSLMGPPAKRLRPLDLSQMANTDIGYQHLESAPGSITYAPPNGHVESYGMRDLGRGANNSLLSATIFSPMHRRGQQMPHMHAQHAHVIPRT